MALKWIMSGIAKIYLKLFFTLGTFFGLLMGLTIAMEEGLLFGALQGIESGLFFGGVMSLIMGTWHVIAVRKNAPVQDENTYRVDQKKVIELRMEFATAVERATKSIGAVKKGFVVDVDPLKGIVNAESKITWNGWGDRIRLDVTSLGADLIRIGISSRPIIPTILVDNGSNLKNIMRISKFLEEQAQRLNPGNQSGEIGVVFDNEARRQEVR